MDVYKNSVNLDKGIWGHPLLEQCGAGNIFLPLGPWATGNILALELYVTSEAFLGTEPEETQRLKVVGGLMRQNLKVSIFFF